MTEVGHPERWLDKKALAEHLDCSVSFIEKRMAEGMPHAMLAGRVKFRASEVEPWLEQHGYSERRAPVAAADQARIESGGMGTTSTIHFVGGHSVEVGWSADEIIDLLGDGGLYEPATTTINLGDGHRLHFNPAHIACIEEHTT